MLECPTVSPSTPLVQPEWCSHRPQLIVRADGKQTLQCADCCYVMQVWSEPVRAEHFDHG